MKIPLLEDWKLYCTNFKSPDTYIEMGFFSLIASSLQRRVWLDSTERPIFPNMYNVLVGPPALGKGLVLRPISEILKYHKKHSILNIADDNEDLRKAVQDLIDTSKKQAVREDPLLIPVAADATTFEALVKENADALSSIKTAQPHPFAKNKIYVHNSLTFLLEEMSSLFKKHSEDVVRYLTTAWDCGEYKYKTKHQGTDIIKKCCLNMLAGTTPTFMQECFSTKLLEDGFTSRVIFVFETKARFIRFDIGEFTQEQMDAKGRIIEHVRKLLNLFGQVTYAEGVREYLKNYYEKIEPTDRPNKSVALDSYYERKNLHIPKLAIAIHFANNPDSFVITMEEALYALEILRKLELNMHLALDTIDETNPIAHLTRKVLTILKRHRVDGMDTRDLWIKVDGHTEYNNVINYLVSTQQIKQEGTVYKINI